MNYTQKKVQELTDDLNHNVSSYEDRTENVESILSDPIVSDYYDNYHNVNLSLTDNLSADTDMAKTLETMADYLLKSEEARQLEKESDDDVILDNSKWKRRTGKDDLLSSFSENEENQDAAENAIYQKGTVTKKNDKKQEITSEDKNRTDELGKILNDYEKLYKAIQSEPNNQKNASKKSRIKDDQLKVKDDFLNVIGYTWKTDNEGSKLDVDLFDLTDIEVLKGKSWQTKKESGFQDGLLCFQPFFHPDNDFSLLLLELDEIIKQAKLTYKQEKLLKLKRKDYTQEKIARILNCTPSNVSQRFDRLAEKVARTAAKQQSPKMKNQKEYKTA